MLFHHTPCLHSELTLPIQHGQHLQVSHKRGMLVQRQWDYQVRMSLHALLLNGSWQLHLLHQFCELAYSAKVRQQRMPEQLEQHGMQVL